MQCSRLDHWGSSKWSLQTSKQRKNVRRLVDANSEQAEEIYRTAYCLSNDMQLCNYMQLLGLKHC